MTPMHSLANYFTSLALEPGVWGPLGFFLGAFIEELIAPLPSPLLLIGAAFFFGKPLTLIVIGRIVWQVIIPITLGATVGSLVIYALAYTGGKSAINRFEKWLGFSWEHVEKVRVKLQKNKSDELLLLLSRSIPLTPTTIITVAAGVMRVNVWMYTLTTLLGVFIRVSILFIGALIFGHSFFG